jgi:hypothetical protein
MNRLPSIFATLAAAAILTACGSGEVVVVAQLEGAAGEAGAQEGVVLRDLEVYLLPYDRDVIFDSLERAYPEPEPPIPDTILKLQGAIAAAQREWQQAEASWAALRDSLQTINQQMQGLGRTEARYVLLFREFDAVERSVTTAERQSQQAFNRFTSLQTELGNQSQEVQLVRELWADEAFAEVETVIAARLKAAGRDEVADTTTAAGTARFRPKPGRWWVHARYGLPYEELYWNIPVEVTRGDPVEVRLTRANAQVRPKL